MMGKKTQDGLLEVRQLSDKGNYPSTAATLSDGGEAGEEDALGGGPPIW